MRPRRLRLRIAKDDFLIGQQARDAGVLGHEQRPRHAQIGGKTLQHDADFAPTRLRESARALQLLEDMWQEIPRQHVAGLFDLRGERQDLVAAAMIGSAQFVAVKRGQIGFYRRVEPVDQARRGGGSGRRGFCLPFLIASLASAINS